MGHAAAAALEGWGRRGHPGTRDVAAVASSGAPGECPWLWLYTASCSPALMAPQMPSAGATVSHKAPASAWCNLTTYLSAPEPMPHSSHRFVVHSWHCRIQAAPLSSCRDALGRRAAPPFWHCRLCSVACILRRCLRSAAHGSLPRLMAATAAAAAATGTAAAGVTPNAPCSLTMTRRCLRAPLAA